MPPGKVQNDPVGKLWSERRGSNPRPPAPKAGALPLRYTPIWPPARCRRPRPRWQPFCLASAQTIAAPVPATTRGRARSLPVRGGKRKARPQVAPGPGLLIGKDIQQPFIRRDFMKNETIELVDEKIDHLYAMQMAGYSTICGLLFAQLKQNSFGRTLSRDELEECLLWGREALADSYLESLQSRQASSQNRRPKNV